jgi:3-oxo-5-alpha-steroid 4-dehydrogenase 1
VAGLELYDLVLLGGLLFAAVAAVGTIVLRTPYGRFSSPRFGPGLPPRLGWFLMELPAIPAFLLFYLRGPRALEPMPLLFVAVWLLHYGNRSVVYPALIRQRPGSRVSLVVVLTGMVVCVAHGYLYGSYLSGPTTHLDASWLADPRFAAGLLLYGLGLGLNIHSDAILRRLRREREVADADAYRVPHGGAFRLVSCPNYLGELVAWVGLLLASWCPGGWFILAVSAANLVPRAVATHRWYRRRFPDYPPERRALVPFVF